MFGAKLGLSSMMAAGLGNTVADVVGINISHTIEVGACLQQLFGGGGTNTFQCTSGTVSCTHSRLAASRTCLDGWRVVSCSLLHTLRQASCCSDGHVCAEDDVT
jgi:hypothetical protein